MPERLGLAGPLPGNQTAWLADPMPRKVLAQGRRAGKSKGCFFAALIGHGPLINGQHKFPGIMQGKDIVWFSQDFPNLNKVVWDGYIERMFYDQPYATLNAQEHTLSIQSAGTLYLQSAEALSGARGIGEHTQGVIIDEAAHLDLETALQRVILPALLDNHGWLIVSSTTNSGHDGNKEHRIPSYFNMICDQIVSGKRPNWSLHEATAFDNPILSTEDINELIAEYPPGSIALREEIYAERLAPGGGSAFPMLEREKHIIPAKHIESWWTLWGALDWGYNHPWHFCLGGLDEQDNHYLIDSVSGRGDLPNTIAVKIINMLQQHNLKPDQLYQVAAGKDTFNKLRARGEDTPRISEQMARMGLTRLVEANTDRVAGLNNLRWYLSTTDATGVPITPALRFFDTPANQKGFECLQRTVLDPKHPEDALKVDAVSGHGGDDFYDCARYLMAARPYQATKPEEAEIENLWDPEILRAEYEQTHLIKNRNKRREQGDEYAPQRSLAELDPMWGEF